MVYEASIKTLYLFGQQSCEVFNELKRCASKSSVLRYNQKAGESVPKAKRKVAEIPHRFDRHWTKIWKICPNPNVLAYTQANMHIRVYVLNMAWEKVPTFLKSHLYRQNPNYNYFRVPIHFALNRFTFEKFPPPPPLLHPIIWGGYD